MQPVLPVGDRAGSVSCACVHDAASLVPRTANRQVQAAGPAPGDHGFRYLNGTDRAGRNEQMSRHCPCRSRVEARDRSIPFVFVTNPASRT